MKKVRTPAPSVFEYSDYRLYLQEWFRWAKEERRLTYARFAALAGLKSHGLVSMILRGSRNLTVNVQGDFARVIGLNSRERDFFFSLVALGQAKNYPSKLSALARLQSVASKHSETLITQLDGKQLYLKEWFIPVVREVIKLPWVTHSPEALSAATGKKISPAEVSQALQTLLQLVMIQQDPKTGRYTPSEGAFELSSAQQDLVIRNYHSRVLRYAQKAAEEQSVRSRKLSSLCIATSSQRLVRIREKIDEFRRELNLLMEIDPEEKVDQVVILNTQLLEIIGDGASV